MTEEEFKKLGIGDIVRSSSNHRPYIVSGNYGNHVTAVATIDITNPIEWVIVRKVKSVDKEG